MLTRSLINPSIRHSQPILPNLFQIHSPILPHSPTPSVHHSSTLCICPVESILPGPNSTHSSSHIHKHRHRCGSSSRFTHQFHVQRRRCLPCVRPSEAFLPRDTRWAAGPSFIVSSARTQRAQLFIAPLPNDQSSHCAFNAGIYHQESRLFVGGSPTTNSFAIVIWPGWRNGCGRGTTWDCSRAVSPLPFTETPRLPNSKKQILLVMVIGG